MPALENFILVILGLHNFQMTNLEVVPEIPVPAEFCPNLQQVE